MTNEQIELEAEDRSRTISWAHHWVNIASFLQKRGYSRTHHACKTHWHRVAKFSAEAAEVRHGSPDSNGTTRSPSNTLDDFSSGKRCLPQEMDICGEEGPTPPPKKLRAGDILSREAVESNHTPSRSSSKRLSDRFQPTLEGEQGPRTNAYGPTTSNPNIPNRKTTHSMAITNLIAPSYESLGQNERQQGSNTSESETGESNSANSQRPIASPGTPSTSISSDNEQQAWASRKVQSIQTEIQTLKGDVAERTNTVASIDQDLRKLETEFETYDGAIAQDMARGLREIKEDYNMKLETLKSTLMKLAESRMNELDGEYNRKLDNQNELKNESNRKFDALTSKLLTLGESKRHELDRLNSNALEISRKVKGLVCYKGIINYLDREERGGN